MTTPDLDLARVALEWRKRNYGGRLGVRWPAGSKQGDDARPIMVVMWDGGGTGELGTFYSADLAESMQTICDLANWAMERLAPSETDFYGTRTYIQDAEMP